MRDLDIRGAGNLLGGEQSGFMVEIGFEMYQKILAEAVRELKRSDFKELFQEEISQQDDFVQDCTIDTDLEIMIPDAYVENIGERLSLYTRLDQSENEEELLAMQDEMTDRFGLMPKSVADLFETVRARKLAIALGFEKMTLKEETLRCYFINRPDSPYFESDLFKSLLTFTQTSMNNAHFKQVGKLFVLVIKDIPTMEDCHRVLQKMYSGVVK
jgi:transcription-repair coupling factor (superfamily II helicase)